ncbi:hypothetical protein BH23GEM9_BH23GEM9_25590 [soil metagenome]
MNSPQASTGFALIHGAGLAGWIWRDVGAALALPHLACEYPGRDAPSRISSLGLADYVSHIEGQIAAWPVPNVVLVAHSIGGVVALSVAEALGPRVAGFVAVSAAIPADGGSFLSVLPLPQRILTRVIMRVFGTRPPASAIRSGMCSDLPAATATDVVRRFVPEALRLYTDPAGAVVPAVPRLYIRSTEDREFSTGLQDRMIENLDADEVVDVETGHLPMLAAPGHVAAALNRFVDEMV